MSSAVFWKSPPWLHLIAVPKVNCSTRLVHWQQNSCHCRLSVCTEQTAGTCWLIAEVNRSSTCSTHDRHSGANPWRHLKTRTTVVNLILCRTGSQWGSRITGVMWSNFLAPVTRQAAAFWSDCSLSSSQRVGKGKVFPYSLPSVGPGADPGVQAVSPQVTWSESRHIPSSSLPLLSARPAFTFVAFTRWCYL